MSFQQNLNSKIQGHLSQIDGRFSNVKVLDQFESNTKLPRSYAIIGFAGFYLLLTFLNIGGIGQLLSNIAGFVLPGYLSLKALNTATKDDDEDLLIYWVVFALLNIVEFWSKAILYWIPFYWLVKTAFLLYLALPQFGGAKLVYHSVLKPVTDAYLFNGSAGGAAASKPTKLN